MRGNLANQAQRNADVGHIFIQLRDGTSSAPVEVHRFNSLRIKAVADNTVVKVEMNGGTPTNVYGDGLLIPMMTAVTLAANEVILINVGSGVQTHQMSVDELGSPVVPTITYPQQLSPSVIDTRMQETVTVTFSGNVWASEAVEYQPNAY